MQAVSGRMATVSFHPVKHICCVRGALLTNSEEIARKAELLRSAESQEILIKVKTDPGITSRSNLVGIFGSPIFMPLRGRATV